MTPPKTMNTTEFRLLVEDWDPHERPIHCSNCLHCVVLGDGVHYPTVSCDKGHGREASLWQLTRTRRPTGFRRASECPDFEAMDDGTPTVSAANKQKAERSS